ncbi:unnamed protein product [Owenia fusiformis]|uniref:Transporter n=1 Tax=Owenia fusiformis TaxID=6347 RepID=A0A8J1UYM6_OWEFU|nr:unnamed protein product [Owenia fusiformis]
MGKPTECEGDEKNGEKLQEEAVNDKLVPHHQHYADTPPEAEENDIEAAPSGDERETWGKKVDFLLSVIGFAVDLANVWRFPYLCYKNGGGAFLVPYVIMLITGGIPLFYMELALGQYHRKGAITCWGRICPLFKGVGYAVVLIAFYVDFFYNVIIAWALYFFFASFTTTLPWVTCNNYWNTPDCVDGMKSVVPNNSTNMTLYINGLSNMTMYDSVANINSSAVNVSSAVNNGTSAAQEFFERGMLELNKAGGIGEVGKIKWQLALCLLAVYVICYFSLWKGISTSGKVVWFTAIFPYVVLLILLVRGVTLKGASLGISYYLTPTFDKLTNAQVWVDAATQVFFSLGPGFGVLLAFSSYNKFHNNVYLDALATSSINCCTSFLAGFVIFSVLGYMAETSGKDIKEVAKDGPGLVFIVYPEAISTLPGSTFWAIIFFMMLLTLGLDSSFGGSEAIITAISDEFPIVRKKREIFVACLFSLYFFVGLASVTYGGAYVVNLLDRYAAGYSILIAVFFEAIAVSWFYGVDRFCKDIEDMLGFRPGIYWRVCWKFVAPVFLLFIIVFGLVFHEPLTYEKYVYPGWANMIGWLIAMSSVVCIPGVALIQIIRAPGTLLEKLRFVITPWRETQKHTVHAQTNDIRLNGGHPMDAV